MSDNPFEVPESMRGAAKQSVDQAKSAYDQFMDASRKAQEMAEKSSGAMLESAKKIQQKALDFAAENTKSGFDLAEKLVRAKDFMEAIEIQSTYARQQMEAYSRQAQTLTQMMSEAASKAQAQDK
jgi:phasin